MKITLYMAISIAWFIATKDWGSNWISEHDIVIFDKITADSDCVIVWNNTYHQYKWEIYPISQTCNIVVSTKNQENVENVVFAKNPKEAFDIAKKQWCKDVLLVWGGHINGSFLEENLIDEIVIDIQPIILGEWIKIFEKLTKKIDLDFLEHKEIKWWLNILKYKINKWNKTS